MNRRDFLERFLYALTAALLALFGMRPELSLDEIRDAAKKTAREMTQEGDSSIREVSDVLKRLYPQPSVYRFAYGSML